MLLKDYMHKTFPNLELRPPLFYSWDVGIRFELGVEGEGEYAYPNKFYIQECYKRAITLFESLHSSSDDIFIVIDVNDFNEGKSIKRKLGNFSPYVEKPLLYRLNHQIKPYVFPEDDEEAQYKTHRFALKCKTHDFKYVSLLKAICNQDLGIRPSIFNRVYFVNVDKETIFHVYDDRGCDVLATSSESISDIYKRYNNWILDYDKPEIDKVFNGL
ncbi:DUF3885 domain-containing protein [Priestia filamentosa]|uniref:DUF3885 domain-containing protein n=1 Tax=Priestia filamentosa TaxID=1402861 RepID=UPI001FB533BA|nr:DUF3885 domain-containing protein [Priestia filamentosa]